MASAAVHGSYVSSQHGVCVGMATAGERSVKSPASLSLSLVIQQEHHLKWKSGGAGMTDDQVIGFVDR